ncbi:MAG: ABC-F family ATP-binding cassette domain-containing protein [Anaerolineae bacterium]|jgi:ATP-binding cassette subfamily F protein 3|nr:ABC-F family ATP-binding cassette domain-containing protein [Anaerolineae bacterium]
MIISRMNHITFSYPTQLVLDDLSWDIHSDRVVGLLGVNGSGKSTLLKLLVDILRPDSGTIITERWARVRYLEQEPFLDDESTVWDSAYQANGDIHTIDIELKHIEEAMAQPANYMDDKKLTRLVTRQQLLLEEFDHHGGLNYESRVITTLADFGFDESQFELPIRLLSGGQKKLLALAGIALDNPNILLLDEPDNHLDIDGKDKLQRFINRFDGAVILVTHDRYLLDLVVDEIAELEGGKLAFYPGNYSEYAFEKEHRAQLALHHYEVQQKEIKRLEEAANRLLTWGRTYDNEKLIYRGFAIMKRIEQMDKVEKPYEAGPQMDLSLTGWRGSDIVLRLENLSHAFPEDEHGSALTLFTDANLELRHGERVGLVGPNGCGKSMLIKFVREEVQHNSGRIYMGPSVQSAYYAQQHETLDPKKTLIQTIQDARSMSDQRAVAFLTKFRYSYEQMRDPVGNLSGGERSRMQLAKMMLSGANFLMMDEPTNHLDIASAEVLEEQLAEFIGSLLIVSHDRYFLDRICTRIVAVEETKLISYPGNYSNYLKQRNRG